MGSRKGFSKIVLLVLVVVAALAGGVVLLRGKNSTPVNTSQHQSQDQKAQQDNSYQGYGFKRPFYSKDGVSFQHYWPGDGSFSNEETEILVINEGGSRVQIKSYDMAYAIDGKSYSQKSGTWEKFPSKQSWDRIEYLNISPQYYKGEPLILEVGQKGKLHWHLNISQPPPKSIHTFHIKLSYTLGGAPQNFDQKLESEITLRTGLQDSH